MAACRRAGSTRLPAAGCAAEHALDSLAACRLPVAGSGQGLHRQSRQSCVRRLEVLLDEFAVAALGEHADLLLGLASAFWHWRVSTTPRSNWRRDSSSGSSPCSSRCDDGLELREGRLEVGCGLFLSGHALLPPRREGARSVLHESKSGVRICLNRPVTAAGLDEEDIVNLKGSKTEGNLKAAFAGESQANRRYLYFAQKADVEGYNDVAAVFRSTAEGETGPCARPPRVSRAGRRSGDGPADRRHVRQPEGGDRRRDARVHGHVPGHVEDRRATKASGDRRLVRDAGEGRALARQPLPEGAGPARLSRAALRDAARVNERRNRAAPRGQPRGADTPSARLGRLRQFWDEDGARSPSSSASSTSATAAGAASASAIRFPVLFEHVDESPTGEVAAVPQAARWEVVDHCYLCDMCYMSKCPYVPPHPWNVDFPHLMLRAKAVRNRRQGGACSAIACCRRPTSSGASRAFRSCARS